MQISRSNYKNNKISFSGIKQEKILAEKLLSESKQFLPYIKSNTFVRAKIQLHYKNRKYNDLIEKLNSLAILYSANISLLRNTLRQHHYKTFEQLVNKLNFLVPKIGYANCGELNYQLQYKFLMNKIKAHAVMMQSYNMSTLDKNKWKNHTFVIFNLKSGAKLDEPSTWGNKAIIADAWCNIVMKATDALEYYKSFFSINPKKEIILFTGADKIKIR